MRKNKTLFSGSSLTRVETHHDTLTKKRISESISAMKSMVENMVDFTGNVIGRVLRQGHVGEMKSELTPVGYRVSE